MHSQNHIKFEYLLSWRLLFYSRSWDSYLQQCCIQTGSENQSEDSLPGVKAAWAWSWFLNFIHCCGAECVKIIHQSAIPQCLDKGKFSSIAGAEICDPTLSQCLSKDFFEFSVSLFSIANTNKFLHANHSRNSTAPYYIPLYFIKYLVYRIFFQM